MTGFTLITASRLQDGSGRPLAYGRVTFFPTSSTGDVVSVLAGGSGGVIVSKPVSFVVVDGAIAGDIYGNDAQVADTALTNPPNICYRVTITDQTGDAIQGPGYAFVQPTGATWSLDGFVPVPPIPTGTPTPPSTGSGYPLTLIVPDLDGDEWTVGFSDGSLTSAAGGNCLISPSGQHFQLVFDSGSFETIPVDSSVPGQTAIRLTDFVTQYVWTLTVDDDGDITPA